MSAQMRRKSSSDALIGSSSEQGISPALLLTPDLWRGERCCRNFSQNSPRPKVAVIGGAAVEKLANAAAI